MTHSLLSLIAQYGLPVVALMVFAGELGVPTGVPVEVALLLAGGLAIHSFPGLVAGTLLVVVADILGTFTLYLVVRTGGNRLLDRLIRRHAQSADDGVLARWRQRLGRRDVLAVFIARLLPLVRMWASVSAALLRISTRDFLLGAAPASLIWAGTPLIVGYHFRSRVPSLAAHYTQVVHVLLLLAPVLGLVAALAWWASRGGSLRSRLQRGRLAIGAAAVIVCLVFIIETVWTTDRLNDHHRASFSASLLLFWLTLLGLLAVALLVVVWGDLRTWRRENRGASRTRLSGGEMITILLWIILIGLSGAVITVIEQRYPAL